MPSNCNVFRLTSLLNKSLCKSCRHLSTLPVVQNEDVEVKVNKLGLGITEFIGNYGIVTGTIKENPLDFQVHEIDLKGKKIQITDYNVPPELLTDPEKVRHIRCILYKDKVEQSDAVRFLSSKLGLNAKEFRIAGRKDKFAQTTQQLCITNCTSQNLVKILPDWSRIKLGNFSSYSNTADHLIYGQLRGNHFKLLSRNLQYDDSTSSVQNIIKGRVESLTTKGFINYFGSQRVGGVTKEIGCAILQRKWEQVFDMMLTPQFNDKDYVVEIKNLWLKNRECPSKLFQMIPVSERKGSLLATIFRGMADYQKGKTDLQTLYVNFPRGPRFPHVSAFTSYLWNHLCSYRIREFGLEPIPGDIVFTNPPSELNIISENNSQNENFNWKWKSQPDVKILTGDDLIPNSKGQKRYSIHDVLLPVLGSRSPFYSSQILQKFNKELLAQHGLEEDCFANLDYLINEVELGHHRRLVVKPQNLSYELIPYDDSDNLKKLMPSDLKLIKKSKNPRRDYGPDLNEESREETPKDKLCLVIQFVIPKSCYATMLMREVINESNPGQFDKVSSD